MIKNDLTANHVYQKSAALIPIENDYFTLNNYNAWQYGKVIQLYLLLVIKSKSANTAGYVKIAEIPDSISPANNIFYHAAVVESHNAYCVLQLINRDVYLNLQSLSDITGLHIPVTITYISTV